MLREIKPRNARSARALARREPQAHENTKTALFLRASKSSSLANDAAGDLYALRKPLALRFSKKNDVHPFEDASSLEFFSAKNDASLLCLSSHSKKRPNCLTFVRAYAGRVLDMLECIVAPETARTMHQFGSRTVRSGLKPLLSFSGLPFEEDADAVAEGDGSSSSSGGKFALAKSLFTDFFKGDDIQQVDVSGLQCLISFAASEEAVAGGEPRCMVYMRVWRLVTKRSGQKLPRVELEEIGPRLDFRLGRVRTADKATMKEAMKQARGSEPRTKKNIETDAMGDKTGRIHVGRLDLDGLQTRKMKGLKRGRDEEMDVGGQSEVEGIEMDDAEGLLSAGEGKEAVSPKRPRTAMEA